MGFDRFELNFSLSYCPPNVTLSQIWIDHGISRCFIDTVLSSASLAFMLIFGLIQIHFYNKYATPVQHYILPYSQLFGIQIVLNMLMPVVALVRIIIEIFVLQPVGFYGFMILYFLSQLIIWPIVCLLILRERNFMLPTVPAKGHGLVLLFFWTMTFAVQNLKLLNIRNPNWFFAFKDANDIIGFSLFTFQYLITGAIFLIGLKAPGMPSIRHSDSFTRLNADLDEESESSGSAFKNLFKKIKMLAPYMWPKKSFKLQLYVLICVLTLFIGRVLNVYVPIYNKKIIDSMTTNASSVSYFTSSVEFGSYHLIFRWDLILILVGLKVVQGGGTGGSGLLNTIRTLLWISIEQYTTREVEVSFFEHLHNLSLRWHLGRKTGEVLSAMDRGTDSINNILNYFIFSILPTIADIIIAVVYFTTFFNGWFGLIVFTTMILYLIATFVITEWRTKYRRSMNLAANEQKQQSIDSLLNFETVKYFANEKYEIDRYAKSIIKYQKEEWKMNASLVFLNMAQLILINGGLLAGSLLCVSMVVNKEGLTVGDYVLFTSYLIQLYGPLNYFGTYYRLLQRCFVDMENMLDLFKEKQEVKDDPAAPSLRVKGGAVEFRNVTFSYVPGKVVLNNVSFKVPAGKSVALVGPSGGGKTSIMRLLFRFYDPTNGEILIDNQVIKNVKQESLRRCIGVVPQDTVLFNDTIKNNILYGRIGSTENEMFEASRAACIHEKIAAFPESYDTKVGERGLKLSGGEKQRVAIARTILKNPTLILLDEATSALDTHTERQIQASLQELCKDRTSIIVAHRLSTIIHADQILVLSDGQISECGTHGDLMEADGIYASMWNEQLKSETVGKNGKEE